MGKEIVKQEEPGFFARDRHPDWPDNALAQHTGEGRLPPGSARRRQIPFFVFK